MTSPLCTSGRSSARISAWWRAALGLAVTFGAALLVPNPGSSQEPEQVAAPSHRILVLDLGECLRLAMQRQPRLAAQRASIAAAEDSLRALENVHIPELIAPELAVRRRQASLGVAAANAGMEQAEREAVYAVTRSYLTVLFARAQATLAQGIVDRLSATRDTAKNQLDKGARDVSESDVKRATVYLCLAEAKQVEAAQGVKRALVALREAIGLGIDTGLGIPANQLPDAAVIPSRDKVVAQAQSHRGELVRATIFAEAALLEIRAQGTNLNKRIETFAASADIHAQVLPSGNSGRDYSPAALAPEMPILLVGSCIDRKRRAQSLAARAEAVTETTANLIALEAEDAYYRWEEAHQQVLKAREAADTGDALADGLTKDFTANLKVRVDEVISARLLAAQARAQYNEYLYRQVLALADLERVTGGAFSAHLVEASAAPTRETKGGGPR